ncbi:beta-lactamase-like protein [Actinoplanes sp. OR16]|uniref:alkyl/aryl-sulfatase n=1 Tax=Actinoplanes sp. OR16 TaxID=946334 RepID=UPI000F71A0B3|nr:alkyl sulfatase dimerization domain-containing protein [Actinoplanes sp. OR16]BBH70355.1 beta-lactamase-like protein [Actinoplanes sp. OR16]
MSKPAAATIETQHEHLAKSLPFHDRQDFADARRGLIAAPDRVLITGSGDEPVWDTGTYGFLAGEAPATVNPSLWRQSQLTAVHGLFEVVPGIYQVRGYDLSNITFIEGTAGVVVIDPLISAETAAAALALYREHRGDRPVTGLLYTHSHVDHFGGARGVLPGDLADGVPVIAPSGFVEHTVSENVYAGPAMARRAAYMYGAALPRGPQGQVGAGLGQTTSTGTVTLIPPTTFVERTGEELTVDGVRMIFQMAPGSEAPSEMHFYLPDHRAFCAAENATHNLHNILTLRGAEVRDPRAWAGYLSEAIELFGGDLEVVFASHHWPTWGRQRAVEFLGRQRDVYAYLHDQTVRMLNAGLTGPEIAEAFQLPPALEQTWHARGYYGSFSHNVKAVYQRYLGWYDGNPARLWPHPPVEAARRYVDFMGGADVVVARARPYFDGGDFRWVAEVLNHVVFAEPDHAEARALLADTYEQLGYGSENGTWRCVYLTGAYELRHGSVGTPATAASADLVAALTPEQLFDSFAIRVNGPRCWDDVATVDVDVTDLGVVYRLTLRNGVLTHTRAPQAEPAAATIRVTSAELPGLGPATPIEGDPGALRTLLGALDAPDIDFAIVTP